MTLKNLACAGLLFLALQLPSLADQQYIIRVNPSVANSVVGKYAGAWIKQALQGSGAGVFVVNLPSGPFGAFIAQLLQRDPAIQSVQHDDPVGLPISAASTVPASGRPKLPPLVNSKTYVTYFGSPAWGSYVGQPAAGLIGVDSSHRYATGAGVVAIIDTGVDATHPALAGAVLPGWDFTRNLSGGSELADLNQDTTPILDQDTTPILDNSSTIVLNQDTTPILDQDTTPILDSSLPPAFGHGTMVAGLIHLVAPTARILPLKAFNADGSAELSDVIAAVYYAVDHGADVINMSFSSGEDSPELRRAIAYANSRDVICVTSVGNDGQPVMVYPAAYSQAIGVGSTSNTDIRSTFSDYGSDVLLAAPGEGIITTYPRNRYASGWGTSFSTPLVSGAAALLLQMNSGLHVADAAQAITQAQPLPGQGLGAGRLDLAKVCDYESHVSH
jgi:subtilisin family serine protease